MDKVERFSNESHRTGYIAIVLIISFCDMHSQEHAIKREEMVERQISSRGVSDEKVIAALLKVERHLFVSSEYMPHAYEDSPIPIGEAQTISQPFIVAFMTKLLELDKTKNVLEIGTGSGYQTAILAEMSKEIFSIELIESLAKKAKTTLANMNYTNIHLKTGDGYKGWLENAPFDRIIATCSPVKIPLSLQEQLAEGGIMVIPVGERYIQELVVLTKNNGIIKQRAVTGVRFVPMVDAKGNKY